MKEADLGEARRIFRLAFGTFLGVPDPEAFWADREYVFTRWRADPGAALIAEESGKLAGSNFATLGQFWLFRSPNGPARSMGPAHCSETAGSDYGTL